MRVLCKALAVVGALVASPALSIKVGDEFPDKVSFHFGFPPEKITVKDRVADKKVILVGLPGAFTPT